MSLDLKKEIALRDELLAGQERELRLQNKLNSLGYNCGAADGIFGQNTKNAVIAFQRAKGLSTDGIVGPKTWSKLLGLS